jgi:two-component sensor histidine kinase
VADRSEGLAGRVAYYARHGLRPHSPAAFAFAILCVGLATLLRLLVDIVTPQAVPFATYFPAVLAATLIGGRAAGAVATLLSAVVTWYAFITPRFDWTIITRPEAVSLILFVFACSTIIWIADQYRRLLRRLDEEEHYRQVVVDELGHRVKNKLATIHAILRHELRGHTETWDSVSGRLRALSAADDLLLQPDRDGVELRQLLSTELRPYGESRVRMHGEPLRLRGRVPSVLALIAHELATNAAKYGALSVEEGCVRIGWHREAQEIAIDWKESGGPVVAAPERRSFGTNLIERSLGGFSGSARIEFAPDGLVCRIRFPCVPHVAE